MNSPVLGAYSDGSVLAKGVEGFAAALVRVFGTDVSATVRLASVDVALSSGRSEWAGLVVVLYVLREVRAIGIIWQCWREPWAVSDVSEVIVS